MKITLGYSGPTDACLILWNGGQFKEYGIESIAWELLGLYWKGWITGTLSGNIPKKLGMWIWDNRDEDRLVNRK